MNQRRWKIVGMLLAAGGLLFPIGYIAWFVAMATDWSGPPFAKAHFDRVAWKAQKAFTNREGRAKMARDLINHHLRIGMPETAIVDLLTSPDKTWPKEEYSPPLPHDVDEYDMGYAPKSFAGEHYVLRLYFDAQDHYQKAEITKD